ncbi:MAG TPA: hypothetical protein VIR59_07065 [Gaiellaceae bacterium]
MASFSDPPRPRAKAAHAPRLRAEVVAALVLLAYVVSLVIGAAR